MTGFRYRRGIRANYDRQGYIYFSCKNIDKASVEKQKKLKGLCEDAAGVNAPALWAFLTTDISWQKVCMDHELSSATLFRCVKRLYENFPKVL